MHLLHHAGQRLELVRLERQLLGLCAEGEERCGRAVHARLLGGALWRGGRGGRRRWGALTPAAAAAGELGGRLAALLAVPPGEEHLGAVDPGLCRRDECAQLVKLRQRVGDALALLEERLERAQRRARVLLEQGADALLPRDGHGGTLRELGRICLEVRVGEAQAQAPLARRAAHLGGVVEAGDPPARLARGHLAQVAQRAAVHTLVLSLGPLLLLEHVHPGVRHADRLPDHAADTLPGAELTLHHVPIRMLEPLGGGQLLVVLCHCDEQLVMREDRLPPERLVPPGALEAVHDPVGQRKIDRFVQVEPLVEPAVVRLRIGDDKLVRTLVHRIHADALALRTLGAHHRHQLEQDLGVRVEQLRGRAPHRLLEFVRVRAGHTVPGLGLAPVLIVDRVGIVILVVPAEGREHHADVDPRHRHAADLRLDVPQQRVAPDRQVVEVPPAPRVRVQRLLLHRRERVSMRGRVHVGTVLDVHQLMRAVHQAPEGVLHLVLRIVQRALSVLRLGMPTSPLTLVPCTLECLAPLPEAVQAVQLAILEPKRTARAQQALGAVPVRVRHARQRWVEAECVEAAVALVAQQHRLVVLAAGAHLARERAVPALCRRAIRGRHWRC